MPTSFVFLQLLLYMNPSIGLEYSYLTQNCFIFDSTTAVKTGNRVCHNAVPADAEIQQIKSYFGDRQFTWAVDVMDMESITALEKNGLNYRVTLPAMKMKLDEVLCVTDYDPAIKVVEITFNTYDIMSWVAIVSPAFSIPEAELIKLLGMLIGRITPLHLKLYLGYYNQTVAAACMVIVHGECVSLHWIATVPEFRNKGLGLVVTHKALTDAQACGCQQAILLSSNMGKHVYERLGFQEYGAYAIYGNY